MRRKFEAAKMKESESVKEITDRLLKVVTQIRLVGEELSDQHVVEKILVCLLERFKSKISSLEENKDFSQISIPKLVNVLQATEHRRSLRMEESMESALVAYTKGKAQGRSSPSKKSYGGKEKEEEATRKEEVGKSLHLVLITRRTIIMKTFVGSGLELNVRPVISLAMWRRHAKIRQTRKRSQLKLLRITNILRSSC